MRKETFCDVLGEMDDAYILEAHLPEKRRMQGLTRWLGLAACLCLAVVLGTGLWNSRPVEETGDPTGSAPHIVVDGQAYYISPHCIVVNDLPTGFVYGGETIVAGEDNARPYYVSADSPEWIYVFQDAEDQSSDTANYVRYVDERLRGRDLISVNGQLYMSMWSAEDYGEEPDVPADFYKQIESSYGIRIEGNAPTGFVSTGKAEFSGYDTIPRGKLACNKQAAEVFVNPNAPDVVLLATRWHTANPDSSQGEILHEGYDVYLRYDGSLN